MAIRIAGIQQSTRIRINTVPSAFTTWDTSIQTSVYSENNLRAAISGNASTRSIKAYPTVTGGIRYAELKINSFSGGLLPVIGLIAAAAPGSNLDFNNYFAWWPSGSYLSMPGPGNLQAYGTSVAAGETVGILANFNTRQVTFYKNGVSQGTVPYLIPLGSWAIVARSAGQLFPCNVTANFGATPFVYPVAGAAGWTV